MSQSIKATRDALFAALGTIYTGVNAPDGSPTLVSYGNPGNYKPLQIVALMDTRRPITRPTLGPNRSRRSEAELDVVFSVFVPGAEVAQQTATDACEDLIALLESYFRTSPNERLGGVCREAWVSNVDGPHPQLVTTAEGKAVAGRTANATVTVTAAIDY